MPQLQMLTDAIIASLKASNAAPVVEEYPNDGNPKPRNANGTLFVRFENLTSTPTDARYTTVAASFSVSAASKQLNGNHGALALLEKSVGVLAGSTLKLDNGRVLPIALVNVDLMEFQDGFWVYQAQYLIQFPLVPGYQ